MSAIAARASGAEHPFTLRSRNNLAYAYRAAGRLGEAIPLFGGDCRPRSSRSPTGCRPGSPCRSSSPRSLGSTGTS
ncbi:tetratricopeptide repeat protein [Plantactinospora solaniradicis]|uniref:Tetratricopeptide repeat protein n=1 Tax=Plantactinospora solaniradicis TaxID=1723736 RepID=A0ABW1KPZ6_9ACTN